MRTIAERIADTKKQRNDFVESMQSILDVSENENRTFNEDESVRFDDCQAKIKGLDDQLSRFNAAQEIQKTVAEPVNDGGSYDTRHENPRIEVVRNLPKGIAFTRFALALMINKGRLGDAEHFVKGRWGDSSPEVLRAIKTAQMLGGPGALVQRAAVSVGTTTDPTFAKPLVEYQTMADEFIELMRPESIIGQIQGFRQVPFNIRIPRQIAGATANWVGEGKSKPVSKPGFDAITMPSAKVAVIVVITEELARDSRPSAEALCRNDMVAAINSFINSEFINPANAGTASLSPASITNAGQQTPSTGATVAAVMTDVGVMMTNMASQQITSARYWVMNPRTFINLSMLRTAQDIFAFPELAQNMFRGYPVIQSNAVPIDGTQKTIMVLLAPNDILLADDGAVSLDTSTEASLQMDSAPTSPPTAPLVSLWQQNLLGIRAERGIYWMLRHQAAVQVLTGVAY